MPEGPEIHRVADRLAAAVLGKPLVRVEFAFPALKPYERKLRRRAIESISARGKALLTAFDNGWTMYSHNQLYGVWKVAPAGERPVTTRSLRVALETADTAILLYSASDVEMWRSDAIESHPFLAKLGPDVLDPRLDAAAVAERLRLLAFRHRALGGLLLDQGFLAGLGNYLRAEILFAARLLPTARPCDLTTAQLRTLTKACLAIPRLSYATRGVEPKPHMHGGYQAHEGRMFHFRVFKREGQPCERCGTPIVKTTSDSRPLFLCPRCQAAS
ncbi:MAG: endonuclease VIII [Proteobacteria bacterium]|nr:endonuclease VIII [Pseudomonadota bacterium]